MTTKNPEAQGNVVMRALKKRGIDLTGKPTTKIAEAKPTTKKIEKKEKAPHEKKTGGLRKPQIKILKVLYGKGKKDNLPSLSRTKIAFAISETPGKPTSIGDALGISDPEKRAIAEEKAGFKSLISLGYVKARTIDVDGTSETVYALTPSGFNTFSKIA